jgi:hypothetical protein
VHSTQLSLFAAVSKKPSPVPVFLIYAGVIHAIGLALLLPMIITLPGPGGETAPDSAAIDVEIVPAAPLAGKIEPDGEQTSALPSGSPAEGDEADIEADQGAEAVAPASPEAGPEEDEKALPQEEPDEAEPAPVKPAQGAAPKPAKKAAAARRTGKSSVRRTAKTQTKIAPFGGALSGLFSPGAPAATRRR